MTEPAAADLEALSDLATPWCVRVAATLRIADQLVAGETGVDELAAKAGCQAHPLHRVLRHLVGQGVFEEAEPGRFALNDAARGLLDESRRLFLDLDGVGGRFAQGWGSLLPVVRTGRTSYEEIFGLPFWEDLDAHPGLGASFDALMGPVGHGPPDPEVLAAGDWESVRTVVDVGGGTGSLLAAILAARPGVRGTLVDLPKTVARSGETFRAAGVEDRVTTVGQSFFDPLPSGADLYLLSGILNDWPDRETVAILARCAEAARPAGRIVVLGGVKADADESDDLTVELVLLGGRNNTLAEFGELAREAGLAVRRSGPVASGRFAVECGLAD